MGAKTEGQVLGTRRPLEAELIGRHKLPRVAVGAGKAHEYCRASRNNDPANGRVHNADTKHRQNRTRQAQRFIYHLPGQLRLRAKSLKQVGLPQEQAEAVPNELGSCLVSRLEHAMSYVEGLKNVDGGTVTVSIREGRLGKRGQQILTGLPKPKLKLRHEEVLHLDECPGPLNPLVMAEPGPRVRHEGV
jgi:hypothetical protein